MKYGATQISIINVHYIIDEYISAASVTTQFNERIHKRTNVCAFTYELASWPCLSNYFGGLGCSCFVVFFALADGASTIPSNIRGCQSGTWSQRGTKVDGSHHGDNPLLRPTGIQIATKRYATLQAMAPTRIKTVHQTSLLHIESSLDRLGLLSPTHDQRSQQQNGQITLQPGLITSPSFSRPHIVQK